MPPWESASVPSNSCSAISVRHGRSGTPTTSCVPSCGTWDARRLGAVHPRGENDREKAEVFAQCRSGAISVLIGSTEKMGWVPTSSIVRSHSTTSTVLGVPRTSNNERAGSSGRGTSTQMSRSSDT